MNELNYNIIENSVSKDGKYIYFIWSSEKTIDDMTAVTYNISVANCKSITTVEDVSTSPEQCKNILKEMSSISANPENLKNHILNYISEH